MGSTSQTGSAPASASSSSGWAWVASSPTTREPGNRSTSAPVSRRSTARSTTVTRSSGSSAVGLPSMSFAARARKRPVTPVATTSVRSRLTRSTSDTLLLALQAGVDERAGRRGDGRIRIELVAQGPNGRPAGLGSQRAIGVDGVEALAELLQRLGLGLARGPLAQLLPEGERRGQERCLLVAVGILVRQAQDIVVEIEAAGQRHHHHRGRVEGGVGIATPLGGIRPIGRDAR